MSRSGRERRVGLNTMRSLSSYYCGEFSYLYQSFEAVRTVIDPPRIGSV